MKIDHVVRMRDERWAKRVLKWGHFDQKRSRGKPPERWVTQMIPDTQESIEGTKLATRGEREGLMKFF